ncbi:GtrA family protein [Raineyella sp. W15-4]|uniref:GtrA family protein n=1 Tax=Raineyella sp. W15-4 TaxID=3081651 RepID=UPI0029542FE7|nr:GtrA family protein [Raineyella sp. W15-4]WOQ17979.1 GtrA family protein [Raineyella sp. W15-4]
MINPGSDAAERPDDDPLAGPPLAHLADPITPEPGSAEAPEESITEAMTIETTTTEAAAAVDDQPDVEHVGLVQQAIRYFGTGVMSAVVDFGLLLILMAVGVAYTPAKAASFVAGTITAYSLNRRFTFKAQPSARRFVLTMLTYVITFTLQVGIFAKLFPLLAQEHLPRLVVQTISFVFGQGAATVANFSLQRWLIFRPTEAPVRENGAVAAE